MVSESAKQVAKGGAVAGGLPAVGNIVGFDDMVANRLDSIVEGDDTTANSTAGGLMVVAGVAALLWVWSSDTLDESQQVWVIALALGVISYGIQVYVEATE